MPHPRVRATLSEGRPGQQGAVRGTTGIRWDDYPVTGAHDELIGGAGLLRPGTEPLCAYLATLGNDALFERVASAEQLIRLKGDLQLGLFRAQLPRAAHGVELCTGADLLVGEDQVVEMRTIASPVCVDVIYRRMDDLLLDPEAFRPPSWACRS